jgi:hypothetical protein
MNKSFAFAHPYLTGLIVVPALVGIAQAVLVGAIKKARNQ